MSNAVGIGLDCTLEIARCICTLTFCRLRITTRALLLALNGFRQRREQPPLDIGGAARRLAPLR
eukprot:5043940-Prymnesium_polylepis.1